MIHFDPLAKREALQKIETVSMEPDFWNDQERAQQMMREMRILKDVITKYDTLREEFENLEIAYELSAEENEYEKEVTNIIKTLLLKTDAMEVETMLSEPYDQHSAILSIHPGAG